MAAQRSILLLRCMLHHHHNNAGTRNYFVVHHMEAQESLGNLLVINPRRRGICNYRPLRIIAIFLWLMMTIIPASGSSSAERTARKVKAAYIFKFLLFVKWPHATDRLSAPPLRVGIIGDEELTAAFAPIAGESVGGRAVHIKGKHDLPEESELDDFDALYISSQAGGRRRELMREAERRGILTIGDDPNFIDSGGMIEFVVVENRLRFVINKAAIDRAGLELSAQMFRVALNVVRR